MGEKMKPLAIFPLLISLFLSSCASFSIPTSSNSNPNAVYKYDLSLTVNGVAYNGVAVIPKAPKYTINIESRTDVDLFTITSCHRDDSALSVINVNWFHPKRGYTYTYNPVAGLEDQGSCLLRVGAYNKANGASGFGVLDFQTDMETMPAIVHCNGDMEPNEGVSVCQSRQGLIEMIEFPVQVQIDASHLDPKCQFSSADGKKWQFVMPLGECVIAFKEVGGKRFHRLTTLGFSDIMMKGN